MKQPTEPRKSKYLSKYAYAPAWVNLIWLVLDPDGPALERERRGF